MADIPSVEDIVVINFFKYDLDLIGVQWLAKFTTKYQKV